MFTNEETGHWLAQSTSHFAVVTDFALMETYSGDVVKNVTNSFSLLRRFPHQVIKMHANNQLRRLPSSGRQQDLIDWDQTEDLRLYLIGQSDVILSRAHHALTANHATAEETLATIKAAVSKNVAAFSALEPQVRKMIASRDADGFPHFTRRGVDMVKNHAMEIARGFIVSDPGRQVGPEVDDLVNTFEFRFSASATAIMIIRMSQGRMSELSGDTSRNDVIDANYMACSTYWNGFMTYDGNTAKAYRFLMNTILNEPINT